MILFPKIMSDLITIAVVQREISPGDPPGNLLATIELMNKIAGQGIDLWVLTEMWATGLLDPDDPSSMDLTEEADGPTVDALRAFCRETSSYLLAGTIAVKKKKKVRNTSVMIGPTGRTILQYSKTHLFRPMGEDKIYTAGDKLAMVDVMGIKVGVLICYDIRFPLLTRTLAKNGCEILLVPALWPDARIDQWETLIRARAIENQFYVVGANGILNQGNVFYPGHSLIADPSGELLNIPEMRETVIVRKLSVNLIRDVRRHICYIDEEREIKEIE
jgi:omega-amidase